MLIQISGENNMIENKHNKIIKQRKKDTKYIDVWIYIFESLYKMILQIDNFV